MKKLTKSDIKWQAERQEFLKKAEAQLQEKGLPTTRTETAVTTTVDGHILIVQLGGTCYIDGKMVMVMGVEHALARFGLLIGRNFGSLYSTTNPY